MPAKTIFLVDDQEPMRRLLMRCLKRFRPDDTAVEFSSPADLLRAVLDGKMPDLVLTDRDMPEMTGEQLASSLKYMGYDDSVVMITGSVEIGIPPRHVDELMRKPFELKHFEEMLSRHLDGG